MFTERHVNRAMGHKFDISEANIHHWRNDSNFIFSYKATIKCLQDLKEEDIYK